MEKVLNNCSEIAGSVLKQATILTTSTLKPDQHKREPSPSECRCEFCPVVGQTSGKAQNTQVEQRFGSLDAAGKKMKTWLRALQHRCCWTWECLLGCSCVEQARIRLAECPEVYLQHRKRLAAQSTRPEETILLYVHSTCLWLRGRFVTLSN